MTTTPSPPTEAESAAPPPAPRRRRLRNALKISGAGCLLLVLLGLLLGAVTTVSYRSGLAQGQASAVEIAAQQDAALQAAPGAACTPARPAAVGETEQLITVDGQERRHLLYVPASYDPARQQPLVVSLHGSGSTPEEQRDYAQWNVFAEANNFVVVYPAASDVSNRTFVSFRFPGLTEEENLGDVRYMEALLDELEATLCIDPDRVYVNGFSAGGVMSLFLACRLPERFAAIGAVSAPFWSELDDPAWCPPGDAMPTIAFQGTADRVVDVDGGAFPFDLTYLGYKAWLDSWATRNGCQEMGPPAPLSPSVTVSRADGCPTAGDLVAYTIDGGGHAWPGGSPLQDFSLGATTTEIAATDAMWAFFVGSEPKQEGND